MLLDLKTGAVVAQTALGTDPLAVTLAADGRTAYVVDNDLGDVFALRLPSFKQAWRTHVGGQPGGLLLQGSSLFVSRYEAAAITELDATTGRVLSTRGTAPRPGEMVIWQEQLVTSGDHGFGVAVAGDSLWTYASLRLPAGLKPFWLQPGSRGELLATAEGTPEDTAAGGVFSIDTASGQATLLATPRDPDEAVRSGDEVFVAAHGDHHVLVLRGGKQVAWAPGAEAVALAPDAALGLLVVVTDADE